MFKYQYLQNKAAIAVAVFMYNVICLHKSEVDELGITSNDSSYSGPPTVAAAASLPTLLD